MKKISFLLAFVAVCILISGCGQRENAAAAQSESAEVLAVRDKISAIGEVTLESEALIADAEQAYVALSAEEQAQVENYADLVAAREAYDAALHDAAIQEFTDRVKGKWVPESSFLMKGQDYSITINSGGKANISVSEDGIHREGNSLYYTGSYKIEDHTWSYDLNNGRFSIDKDSKQVRLFEEDGFLKLYYHDLVYVKESELNDVIEKKYLTIDLSQIDLSEVFGEAVLIEPYPDLPGYSYYFFPSKLYDQGWIYVGEKYAKLNGGNPFSTRISDKAPVLERGTGYVFFVREGYVKQVSYRDGHRFVRLTDGERFEAGYRVCVQNDDGSQKELKY